MTRTDVHKARATSAREDPAETAEHVNADSSAASARESTADGA